MDSASHVQILVIGDAAGAGVDQGSPLIIRGGCERARSIWSEQRLGDLLGDRSCGVSLDSRPASPAHKASATFREYLQRQEEGGGRGLEYLFHTDADASTASTLRDGLDLPPEIQRLAATGVHRFYAGPANTGTLPHIHTYAINALLRGRKQWAVYVGADPAETDALVQEAYERYGSGAQAIDWFGTECARLRSRAVRLSEFVQIAGDVVCIPALHLHAVLNLEPVLGFTLELAA